MNFAVRLASYTIFFIVITFAVVLLLAETSTGTFLTNLVIATGFWHLLENSLGIIGVDGEEDLIFGSYILAGCIVAAIFLLLQIRFFAKSNKPSA